MRPSRTLEIGRDVHNDSSAVADVAQEPGAEVTYLGTLRTRPCDLDHRSRTRPSTARPLRFVYDAGPWGDWRSRSLTPKGHVGWGVAPSLMPNKAGDRVTTDRRDAIPLARLRRSGDLAPVSVPTLADAAMRNLSRAREDAIGARKAATCRLNAFFLWHDIRSTGRATLGPAHLRWLSEVGCPSPAQPSVFQEYVRAVNEHTERLQRLEHERQAPVKAWRLRPVIEALQALRGVQVTVAVTTGAALGDLTRVDHPRELMQCLGLSPSEYSSGERRRQGPLTKAGNTHARRALVAGAWAYRDPANVSRHLQLRLENHPKAVQDSSWKAQVRLCKRYRRFMARGKHAN